ARCSRRNRYGRDSGPAWPFHSRLGARPPTVAAPRGGLPLAAMWSTSSRMAPVHVAPSDYKDLVLFLATAGIVVPLFKRLKIRPILGFLAAGVSVGPFG